MLGFVLSKMNLLILVIALFAIVAYFMFSLGETMKHNQAGLIISRYTKDASSMLTSATYCDRVTFHLPPQISVLGQPAYYYEMLVTSADDDDNPFNGNFLVFAVAGKTDPDYILAASSVRANAAMHLYQRDESGYWNEAGEEGLRLDPQALPPDSSFTFIKKVIQGEDHVFIFPCHPTTLGEVCYTEASEVFEEVRSDYPEFGWGKNQLEEFRC